MKRGRVRTYTIDEWGRIEDLKARVFYMIDPVYTGRKVFIGECPDRWGRNRSTYIAFNLDGSYLSEAYKLEMTKCDLKISKQVRKCRKLIKNIETLKELQDEYRRIKQCQL